jgi:hypothetical protein
VPRQAPDLVPRPAILPRLPKIRDARRRRHIEADHRQVLDMLGEQERSALEHQDSMLMAAVGIEDVRSEGGAERATTDDDDVEGARVTLGAAIRAAAVRISAPEGLVEPVANKTAEHIAGEVGDMGGGSGHGMSLF